jgi:hypothetical protein
MLFFWLVMLDSFVSCCTAAFMEVLCLPTKYVFERRLLTAANADSAAAHKVRLLLSWHTPADSHPCITLCLPACKIFCLLMQSLPAPVLAHPDQQPPMHCSWFAFLYSKKQQRYMPVQPFGHRYHMHTFRCTRLDAYDSGVQMVPQTYNALASYYYYFRCTRLDAYVSGVQVVPRAYNAVASYYYDHIYY